MLCSSTWQERKRKKTSVSRCHTCCFFAQQSLIPYRYSTVCHCISLPTPGSLSLDLSRSPTCPPLGPQRRFSIIFLCIEESRQKVAPSLVLTTSITTHPLKPPQSRKPYIRCIISGKISRFCGLHCALSLGLLGLWLVWLRWKVVISVKETAWAVPVHLSGGLLGMGTRK